jgi:hypothetical protein
MMHWWAHLSYSQAALVAGIPIFVGWVVWIVNLEGDSLLDRPHHSVRRNGPESVP